MSNGGGGGGGDYYCARILFTIVQTVICFPGATSKTKIIHERMK